MNLIKINIKYTFSLVLVALLAMWSACEEKDSDKTSDEVALYSFGPSVLRGDKLHFIGENLMDVERIVLPDNIVVEAADFDSLSAKRIVITVPDEAVEGKVSLEVKNQDDPIVTKTSLSILEPITITSYPETAVRPGSVITIKGTYLNLIEEVIFAINKPVTEFEEQSREVLKVRVPEDAQTGVLLLYDMEEIPNEFKTETEIQVSLPATTELAPATVKAQNDLTITGTNLDLVTELLFPGGESVSSEDFVSVSQTSIVVTVPAASQDGVLNMVVASGLTVESNSSITMLLPTVSSVAPNPVKPGNELTVTGEDLDLISGVVFGGDVAGTVLGGGTATSITVQVPVEAQSGDVTFQTLSNKTVISSSLAMVSPTISTIDDTAKRGDDMLVTGTNLDLITYVEFSGGTMVEVVSPSEVQFSVTVPSAALTGPVTLIAANGDRIESSQELILPNVPEIGGVPSLAVVGKMVTLTGSKLNLTQDVIFPGGVYATEFGDRTSTTLEVMVPAGVTPGPGKISFTTYEGDMTESPEINMVDLSTYSSILYDETIGGGYGNWSWSTNDQSSTDFAISGDVSWKSEHAGGYSGWSIGGSTVDVSSYETFSIFIYGGPGSDGKELWLVVDENWAGDGAIILKEGEWIEAKFNIADIQGGLSSWGRIILQDRGWTGTYYVDHIGFK